MSNVLLADPTSPGASGHYVRSGFCAGRRAHRQCESAHGRLHTEAARADLAGARPPSDLHQQGSGRNAGEGAGGPRRGERSSWIDAFAGLCARKLRAEPDVAGHRDGFKLLDAEDIKRIIRRKMRLAEAAPALWR